MFGARPVRADIDPFNRTVAIRQSKTAAGERIIPMTAEAFDVLTRLRGRVEMFGPVEPLHYIFAGLKVNGRGERHGAVSQSRPDCLSCASMTFDITR